MALHKKRLEAQRAFGQEGNLNPGARLTGRRGVLLLPSSNLTPQMQEPYATTPS